MQKKSAQLPILFPVKKRGRVKFTRLPNTICPVSKTPGKSFNNGFASFSWVITVGLKWCLIVTSAVCAVAVVVRAAVAYMWANTGVVWAIAVSM